MRLDKYDKWTFLFWSFLDDVVWTELKNAYFRLHHEACSKATQYSIHLLKSRYSFGLTKKWTWFKISFFFFHKRNMFSPCVHKPGKSMHDEIIHAHSFILISTIETLYEKCLGLKTWLLLLGVTTVQSVSFGWTMSVFNCRGQENTCKCKFPF
jgi:hypothetical protein